MALTPEIRTDGGETQPTILSEGYADATAAFEHGNPFICEDWGRVAGMPTQDPSGAIRVLENDLAVGTTAAEKHDRGRVFGAVLRDTKPRMQKDWTKVPKAK